MREYGVHVPIIVFAAGFDSTLGVHPAIFAYTNAADELIRYVVDILEPVKFGALL